MVKVLCTGGHENIYRVNPLVPVAGSLLAVRPAGIGVLSCCLAYPVAIQNCRVYTRGSYQIYWCHPHTSFQSFKQKLAITRSKAGSSDCHLTAQNVI